MYMYIMWSILVPNIEGKKILFIIYLEIRGDKIEHRLIQNYNAEKIICFFLIKLMIINLCQWQNNTMVGKNKNKH